MKTIFKASLIAAAICLSGNMMAQNISFGHIQNRMARDKSGVNQFDVKKDTVQFKGLSVYIGGDFAMQYQAVKQSNDQVKGSGTVNGKTYSNYSMADLSSNFNLPTANMAFGAQLADGVRVNLDIYLSSRHHNETWVQGGYLQIDKLDFIKKDFMADVMKYTTIKIGQMENNYGDAHFRRSNNGKALQNSFIGENIMDSFQTDMGAEVYYQRNGWVSMLGITNGKLNGDVKPIAKDGYIAPTILAKFGWDKQINQDLRVRLTGSWNFNSHMSSNPWGSDRAGSRFYNLTSHNAYTFDGASVAQNLTNAATIQGDGYKDTGRFSPGYSGWFNAFMINPFVKFKGFEYFGTFEFTKGGTGKDAAGRDASKSVNQIVNDVVYRFGSTEQFYLGARYAIVSGELEKRGVTDPTINRTEVAAGWYMTKNILAKVEYVNQNYKNFSQASTTALNDYYGYKFNGLMFEAAISF